MIKLFVRQAVYDQYVAARGDAYRDEVEPLIVDRDELGVFLDVDGSLYGRLRFKYTRNAAALWGPRLWAALHAMTDATPEKLAAWRAMIPCSACGEQFDGLLERLPPDFTSDDAFFVRGVEWHDAVNAERGIKPFGVERARLAWRRTA
jgi:hypothetical protein